MGAIALLRGFHCLHGAGCYPHGDQLAAQVEKIAPQIDALSFGRSQNLFSLQKRPRKKNGMYRIGEAQNPGPPEMHFVTMNIDSWENKVDTITETKADIIFLQETRVTEERIKGALSRAAEERGLTRQGALFSAPCY